MSELLLIFNEETGCWERKPEPYTTIQIATQADFEELKAAVEFYNNRDKYVERKSGIWIPLEFDGYADGYPVWELWECSECRYEHKGDEDSLTPYCPDCGAILAERRMKKARKQNDTDQDFSGRGRKDAHTGA